MAIANNGTSLAFGFSAMSILRNDIVIGNGQVVGQFTAEVVPEQVKVEGGAASFPIAAAPGRASGEGSLTLKERPRWIEETLFGGTRTDTAAANDAAAGTITDVSGSSIASALTAAVSTTAVHYMDVEVEATGTSAVRVRVAGSNGAQVFPSEAGSITLSGTATTIGQTGISLSASSANFTTGDRARFAVVPGNGGQSVISVPQVIFGDEYELRVYTARGGANNAIFVYTFPRVFIRGANVGATDVEHPEVEVPIQLLAPEDGGEIYDVRRIERA